MGDTNSSFYADGGVYDTGTVTSNDVPGSTTPSAAPSSMYPGGNLYDNLTLDLTSNAGTALPLMDATLAAVGLATKWARQDHVHPTDTTRAPIASPSFTGDVGVAGTLFVGAADTGLINQVGFGRLAALGSASADYFLVVPSYSFDANPAGSNFAIGSYPSGTGGSNAYLAVSNYNDDGYGDGLYTQYARGTSVAPLAVNSGDSGGGLTWEMHNGTGFHAVAALFAAADGPQTSTSAPASVYVSTVPSGAQTPLNRLKIDSDGKVSVLTNIASTSTTTGALVVAGGAGIGGDLNVGHVANINTSYTGGAYLNLGLAPKAGSSNGGLVMNSDPSVDGATNLTAFWLVQSDPVAANRRMTFGLVENGLAWRNITFGENGGNIGLGIAVPTEKLHVVGNILASGNGTFGGTLAVTGVASGPTAAVDTNTTQFATTAYVLGQAGATNALAAGTAAPGTSLRWSRQDHVHPTDTTRAPLASPAFTGTPTAPTAAANTNTTQIATTAYADAIAALKANLASPTFTGTVGAAAIAATGAVKSSGGALGYATGAGGTVTQATSKATGVTLSKFSGAITLNAAALASGAIVSFVMTNTNIAAGDVLVLNHISGGTIGPYLLNAQCAAGSATINVRNTSAASLSEAIVIQFALVKAVNA